MAPSVITKTQQCTISLTDPHFSNILSHSGSYVLSAFLPHISFLNSKRTEECFVQLLSNQ